MGVRARIIERWEKYWLSWLEKQLIPYQAKIAAQEEKYQALLSRAEQLELDLELQKEQEMAVDLWQEFAEEEENRVVFTSTRLIHPILCTEEDCLERRFRKNRCVVHYEEYLQKERFLGKVN